MIKQKSKADIALFGADDPTKDYIIDSSTNNLSFIRMYKYLKGRGIKNNKFFLRLYHKELLGVNPLDHNNLTPQQKRMIVAECTRNPWYYLRELVRIEAAGTLMRFELSPGNLAIIWSILNSINIYGEMPRQRGKTIAVAAVLNWVYNFGTVNTPMLFGNKSLGDSKNNLKRLKDITTNLPPYVRDAVYDPKADNDKIEAIASAARNNRININGNPRSADDANKMGRGMTIPIWWPDELAFISYNKTVYDSAAPALSKASEIARKSGVPSSKILTSTPNDLDSDSGKFAKFVICDGACMFIEEMYDWGIDKIREYMYDNSRNDFLHIRYTWQELGLDAKWYEQQCRDLNYDWRLINREVNLQWTRTADNAVFDEIQMEQLNRIIRSPISNYLVRVKERLYDENVETLRDYAFKLYHELDKTKEYAIGVDVAAGLDKDFSTIVITDPAEDFNIVGIFKSPIIDTYSLTMLLITLIKHHLPNSTLFIENNSYGKAVIDTCLKYIKDRVYTYYIAPPKKAHKQRVGKDEGKVQYGINNNTSTRPIMMEILRKTVVDSMWMLAYDDLYNEIKGLEYTRDNKIEHGANTHDDVLMAYLIVRYAFANTPNISKYFRGIYSLSEANKPSKETDPAKNLGVTIDIDAVLTYIQNGMTMEEALVQYNKDLEGDNNRVNHKLAGELLRKK